MAFWHKNVVQPPPIADSDVLSAKIAKLQAQITDIYAILDIMQKKTISRIRRNMAVEDKEESNPDVGVIIPTDLNNSSSRTG
jgi:hypothetical protein